MTGQSKVSNILTSIFNTFRGTFQTVISQGTCCISILDRGGWGTLNMFLIFSQQFEYTKSNEPKSNSDERLRISLVISKLLDVFVTFNLLTILILKFLPKWFNVPHAWGTLNHPLGWLHCDVHQISNEKGVKIIYVTIRTKMTNKRINNKTNIAIIMIKKLLQRKQLVSVYYYYSCFEISNIILGYFNLRI